MESGEDKEIMFSVIIPVFKIEEYLERCVDSVLQQTYTDFEVLLVDDGSPDNCPVICDRYAEKDTRVKVIHKKNGGLVSARNAGLRSARGKYICYVDGDDWVEGTLLEGLSEIVRTQKEPDMIIFGAVREYTEYREQIPFHVKSGMYEKEQLRKQIYPYMIYDSHLPFFEGRIFPAAWNKIYKRGLLQKHYCTEEKISIAEDNAFVFECIYYAERIFFTKQVYYHYNCCNNASMVSRYNREYMEKCQLVCEYLKKQLGKKERYLERQLGVFQVAWLIMAVFHEVRYQSSFREGKRRVKKKLRKTAFVREAGFCGLPLFAKGYLLLLKIHCYGAACFLAKMVIDKK